MPRARVRPNTASPNLISKLPPPHVSSFLPLSNPIHPENQRRGPMAKTSIAARKLAGAATGRRLDASTAQPHQCLKSERMAQPHRCCILAGHHNIMVVVSPGEGDSGHHGCKVLVCPVVPATPVFCSSTMAATAGGDFVQQRPQIAAMSCCDGAAATSAVLCGCNGALAGTPGAAMERSLVVSEL